MSIGCAPRAVRTATTGQIHITGSQELGKGTFGPGDQLHLDAGSDQGLASGQLYWVRRVSPPLDRAARDPWFNLHTAGWIRIDDVTSSRAVASIVYACDVIEPGDYLEPYEAPVVPARIPGAGPPDFGNPGHVLFGADRRQAVGDSAVLVIDLGSDHGVRSGQVVTFFRRQPGGPELNLGEGTVLVTLPESATVLVERASRPIYAGDLAAIHR